MSSNLEDEYESTWRGGQVQSLVAERALTLEKTKTPERAKTPEQAKTLDRGKAPNVQTPRPLALDSMIVKPWEQPPTQALAIREQRTNPRLAETRKGWRKRWATWVSVHPLDKVHQRKSWRRNYPAHPVPSSKMIMGANMTFNGRGDRRGGHLFSQHAQNLHRASGEAIIDTWRKSIMSPKWLFIFVLCLEFT